MSFQIESDIPYKAPSRGGRGRKPTQFPFRDMEVGDSFLIPCEHDAKTLASWRRKILVSKKRFVVEEDEYIIIRTSVVDGGLRVWRTE